MPYIQPIAYPAGFQDTMRAAALLKMVAARPRYCGDDSLDAYVRYGWSGCFIGR